MILIHWRHNKVGKVIQLLKKRVRYAGTDNSLKVKSCISEGRKSSIRHRWRFREEVRLSGHPKKMTYHFWDQKTPTSSMQNRPRNPLGLAWKMGTFERVQVATYSTVWRDRNNYLTTGTQNDGKTSFPKSNVRWKCGFRWFTTSERVRFFTVVHLWILKISWLCPLW